MPGKIRHGRRFHASTVKAKQPLSAFRIKAAIHTNILVTNRISRAIRTLHAFQLFDTFKHGVAVIRPTIHTLLVNGAVLIKQAHAVEAGMTFHRAVGTRFASNFSRAHAVETKAIGTIDIEQT